MVGLATSLHEMPSDAIDFSLDFYRVISLIAVWTTNAGIFLIALALGFS
jgi:hypothetical protein